MEIRKFIILFIVYSVVGWIIEVIDQYFRKKKFINRGFLIGPYCPIYGVGAFLMLFALTRFKDEPFILFTTSLFICTVLEYFVGYVLEKVFKARWWDYSNYKLNLNGRICISNSLLFGASGVLLLMFINPFFNKVLSYIPSNIQLIIAILFLLIFVVDMIISFRVVSAIPKLAGNLKIDSTEEIGSKLREIVGSKAVFVKRILFAFPNLLLKLTNDAMTRLRHRNKEKE
jgi:uncharacterized membrane protein